MSSSLPSWKNYGGIGNYDKTTNIAVNNITADNLTLRNAYNGYFTICGELIVSENTFLNSDCIIGGDSTIHGNELIQGNIIVDGNTILGMQLDVSGDTVIWGNLLLMRNFEIVGNLEVDGTMIQLNRIDHSSNYYVNIFADHDFLGINTNTPSATLDIAGKELSTLNVHTTYPANRNILAQNASGNFISLYTDNSTNSIQFHQTQSNAFVSYTNNGTLTLQSPTNTYIPSQLSIGSQQPHSLYNETVTIYDTAAYDYLSTLYEVSGTLYNTGNSLTLISSIADTATTGSNTSLNIVDGKNQSKGMKMVAGSWIQDSNRSFQSMGIYDVCGTFFPTITQVAGSSWTNKRATVGINHFAPAVDKYILDINGPVRIQNGEVAVVNISAFPIQNIVWLESNAHIGIAFGGTYGTTTDANGNTKYLRTILYTTNAGCSWLPSIVNVGDYAYTLDNFNVGHIYDSSNAIVVGDGGIIALSCDGFRTWNTIGHTAISGTINAVRMLKNTDGSIVIVLFYVDGANTEHIGYFLVSSINALSTARDSSTNILNLPSSSNANTTNFMTDIPLSGRTNLPVRLSDLYTLHQITVRPIQSIDAVDGGFMLIAGTGGIFKLAINDVSFNLTKPVLVDPSGGLVHAVLQTTYNCVRIFKQNPLYAIAVGNSIISYTTNGGISWTDVSSNITGVVFRSVFIYSTLCAIAVGSNGAIFASTDGYNTWVDLSKSGILNSNGLGSLLTNTSHTLTSVWMTDANTFFISSIYGNNYSRIFCCTIPDLFNHVNNFVLDVCGNMRLSGSMYIYDNAYISKDVDVSGNVYVSGNEVVDKNVYVSGAIHNTFYEDLSGGVINVGSMSGGKTISIGTGSSVAAPNNITIGTTSDNVNIFGKNLSLNATIRSPNVVNLNAIDFDGHVQNNFGTSKGAGLWFRDYSLNSAGYIVVNPTIDGFLLKAPSADISDNVLNIRTTDLTNLGSSHDVVNNNPITNGFMMIRPSQSVYGSNVNNTNGNYTVTLAPFDVSNILLKDSTVHVSTAGQQFITSDVGIGGSLFITNTTDSSGVSSGSVQLSGGASIAKNVFVGGVLDISNTTDSIGLGNGALVVSGGASIMKTVNIGGGVDVSGIMILGSNTNAVDLSSGSLQVRGGMSVGGSMYSGGVLHLVNTVDATGYGSGVLQVTGGSSFGGTTYHGGKVYINNLADSSGVIGALDVSGLSHFSGVVSLTGSKNSSGVGTGSLQVTGGASIGQLVVTNTTDCSGVGGGSLYVAGGASIGQSVFVGGIVDISNTSDAVGSNTGCLRIGGGMSVSKSSVVGGSNTIGFNNVITAIPITDALGSSWNFTPLSTYVTVSSSDYKAGQYSISTSSETTNSLDNTMLNGAITSGWYSSLYGNDAVGNYLTNPVKSTTTIINSSITSINGAYLQIYLPYRLVATSYLICPLSKYFPKSWYVLGSNDGVNFEIIDSIMNNTTWYLSKSPVSFNVGLASMKTAFSYFRFLVTNKAYDPSSNDNYIGIAQFNLYGIPLALASNSSLASFGGSNILGNMIISGTHTITNTTDSSATNTGALVVRGGMSTYGNAHLGGNCVVYSTVDSSNVGVGALSVYGGASVSKNMNVGNSLNVVNNLSIGNNATIANNLNIGGSLQINSSTYVMGFFGIGTTTPRYALDVSGDMNVSGKFALGTLLLTSNIDSVNLGSGTLVLSNGGASIAGTCNIGGKVFISSSSDASPASAYSGALNVTGGLYVQSTTCLAGDLHVGTNAGAKSVNLYPTVYCLNQSPSISTNTLTPTGWQSGGLQVAGGCGVKGNCYIGSHLTVGGNLYLLGYFTVNSLNLVGNIDSYNTTVGAFTTAGGCGISGNVYMGGNLNVSSLVDSTSPSSGAVVVSGGSGIGGNCFIGGNSTVSKNMLVINQVFALNNQDSYGVNTGSMVNYGGSSIKGNCNIGGNVIIAGTYGSGKFSITFPAQKIFPLAAFSSNLNIGSIPYGGSVGTSYQILVSTNTGLNGYMNGAYTFNSGTVYDPSSTAVQNAFIPGSNASWVSMYPYSNKNGLAYEASGSIIYTTFYNSAGTSTTTINGDYIQFQTPFKQVINNYQLTFVPSVSPYIGVTYPTDWYLLGSNDGVTWTLIHSVSGNTSSAGTSSYSLVPTQYGYLIFRIVFYKLYFTNTDSLANTGLQSWNMTATAIVPINMNNTDSTTTQYDSSGNLIQSSTYTSGSNSQTRIQNINNPCTISSFIGPGTFAGASSLVTFGNVTFYGSLNLFYDFNINGNIYCVNPLYSLTLNSDISHNGNLVVRRYLQVGDVSANANTVLNGNLTMTGSWNTATIDGNLLVNGNSILQKTLTVVGNTYMQNGLYLDNGASITSGAVTINPGTLYILYGGSDISGASYYRSTLTCNDHVTITKNGLTVNNGGINITDLSGLYINQGGFDVSGMTYLRNKLTLTRGGAQIHDGVIIDNSGLFINSGILDMCGNSYFTGKMKITNGGVQVHDGIIVDNSGLFINSGILDMCGNSYFTGKMQITDGGLQVHDGIVVDNSGITVNGGGIQNSGQTYSGQLLTVNSGGANITGLIHGTAGLLIDASGITVSSGGINNTGTIYSSQNLTVNTGGVNVNAGGANIFGNCSIQTSSTTAAILVIQGNSANKGYTNLQVLGGGGAVASGAASCSIAFDTQSRTATDGSLSPSTLLKAIDNGSYSNDLTILTSPTTGSSSWQQAVAAVERVRIAGNGNVGIGTSTPLYLLDVNGQTRLGGNIGINTTPSSTYALNISGSVYTSSSITVNSGGATIKGGLTVSDTGLTVSAGGLTLVGGSTCICTIDNGAYLNAKNSAGTSETFIWPRWTDNVTYMNYGTGGFNIRNNASESAIFIQNGKNVGIQTTSPSTALEVSGTATATSFNAKSDYRLKDIIKPIDNTFIVDKLKPVLYFNIPLQHNDFGFLAHEVQEIFPELVTGEKDGEEMQSINYNGLIAVLVREIQELKQRVKDLEHK